jgi:glycosyltransferase involved in cell wall biosynthesis
MSPAWAGAITGYIGETEKVRVIYNGVDLARFHPDVATDDFRARYGLSGDTRWVTFIGTFATQYDFDTMMAAAQRFADRSDVCFAVIGSGSQGEGLRDRLAADGHGNVRVIDWIDHDEMPAAWCASDVTYWAMRDQSLYRGTIPAKLYEALACGVPVAAATEGVAAGMIAEGGAGYTVPCGDVDGLAGSIERLLDPDQRARCSESARAFAIDHFDPERVADAYEEALLAAQRR